MFKSIIFAVFLTTLFLQPSAQAIKYKVTEKEYIDRCYDWDIYQANICPFPAELEYLCDDCRYDGEGRTQKNGNIIPDGSGNYSNIIIESFIPPNPNPSSEDDFDLQIFNMETQCLGDSNCNRSVRPRVPIISVADIEPEPEVNENNRNVRTRNGFNIIKFEPPSQNWNFNNEYISRSFSNQYGARPNSDSPTGRDLDRVFYAPMGKYRVNVKEDVRDDEGNITGFNINTYKADIDKSTVTFMITTEANNTYTLTFNIREFREVMVRNNFEIVNTKEWSEEFLDGSPAVNVAFVGRNVVKAGLVETNFHEIQNPVNQETVKVGEVETVKEVEIKVEKKDVKVPQNRNEALISMGAPSAKQREFIIDKDLLYPAKIATDALILNYNGEFKKGVPHGKGTVTILNPKTILKYGLYGDYKINLSGTFKNGVFTKLNEIYYLKSGEVFKFTKGVKPYESKFTRNILHGACSGKCKKIKISLDNINLGEPSKKFKNMPGINSKLISQTQLFKNNTPTILSTHVTIEMEDDKGNILPTLGINLPPLARKSLFTLPGYNDFTSANNININDRNMVKELRLNILNLKKTDLENKVKDLLQNSEIKDRKELIKKAKKISKKYKIPPSEFIQKDIFEHLSNDEANNQPMTADYSDLLAAGKSGESANSKKELLPPIRFGYEYDYLYESGLIIDDLGFSRFARGDKTLNIESEPIDHKVDNDFLEKSQSGNAEKISTMESMEFNVAIEAWTTLNPKSDNDTESYYSLIGGNAVVNAFGVAGYAQQVIELLNNSRYFGNLEFLKTNDINYILKSLIETNLPINSRLDLDDEYIKTIFEKSDLEKLGVILEFYFNTLLDDKNPSFQDANSIIEQCKNSPLCNVSFINWNNSDYGMISDDMKKILKVVEESVQNDREGGSEGGGDW
ncbi:MAG: hypothetical protein ACJZ8F_03050 [Candidatus Pelagibacter sp.]